MNSVERVKKILKSRKIPISKLEKDLGFSNGYIGQLRKGSFPAERLQKIAEYLNVSAEYLMTGETLKESQGYYLNDETAKAAQEIFENKELKALFDTARDADPKDIRTAAQVLATLKKGRNENPDEW